MRIKKFLSSLDLPICLFLILIPQTIYFVSKLIIVASSFPPKDFNLVLESFGFFVSLVIFLYFLGFKKLNQNTSITIGIFMGILTAALISDITSSLDPFSEISNHFIIACAFTTAMINFVFMYHQKK